MRIQYEKLTTGELKSKSDLEGYIVIISSSLTEALIYKDGKEVTKVSGSSRHKTMKAVKESLSALNVKFPQETRAKRKQ